LAGDHRRLLGQGVQRGETKAVHGRPQRVRAGRADRAERADVAGRLNRRAWPGVDSAGWSGTQAVGRSALEGRRRPMASWGGDEPGCGKAVAKVKIPETFHRREDVNAATLVVLNVAVVLGAGAAAYWSRSVLACVAEFVLVGARAQALYILQHECM